MCMKRSPSIRSSNLSCIATVVSNRQQYGFTLLEVLACLVIVAILACLLLPSVNQAVDSARRLQCKTHLKELGLALHSYHDAHECFPASSVYASEDPTSNGLGWSIALLPYLQTGAELYNRYQQSRGNHDLENREILTTQFPSMLCPTDRQSVILIQPYDGKTGPLAKGSYVAITGISKAGCIRFWDTPLQANHLNRQKRGLLHLVGIHSIRQERIDDVKDGLAHSVAIGEFSTITAPQAQVFWASSFTHHSSATLMPSPLHRATSNWHYCRKKSKQSCRCDRATASFHKGGSFFLLADGAVRFYSSTQDENVFLAAGTIDGQEQVESD